MLIILHLILLELLPILIDKQIAVQIVASLKEFGRNQRTQEIGLWCLRNFTFDGNCHLKVFANLLRKGEKVCS